jgi:hypothetical protein
MNSIEVKSVGNAPSKLELMEPHRYESPTDDILSSPDEEIFVESSQERKKDGAVGFAIEAAGSHRGF